MALKVKDVQRVLEHPEMEVDTVLMGRFGLEITNTAISQNGELYGAAHLYDYTGSVRVYTSAEHWGGSLPQELTDANLAIQFEFSRNGDLVPVALPVKQEVMPPRSSIELLPAHRVPKPEDLPRLVALAESLESEAYRQFMVSVFSDPPFAVDFLTLPAAYRCHHAEPGGLLRHSLEVAEGIQRLDLKMHPLKRDAGILLGLFHDVGKVLLSQDKARTLPCRFHHHPDLIGIVLDDSLSMLKWLDPDAYWAFWQVMHAYQTKNYFDAPLAKVVAGLDGVSAQQDVETRGRDQRSNRSYWRHMESRPGGPLVRVWSPPDDRDLISP
ncbi:MULTISPECIES: HD domain-containing protein [Ectothiorhodospira]|uniref:HD domain-containing protein n=1 Tax=Ectothiorhodospira TaxID=1051 RepID=UPI001EE90A6F|nr:MULTISPECIES: HD domain-containing protein [Ectothiorhodospira]MCG5495966.1 HD domain-containing protein [Ectothiorhodospira variabilis]MCG5498509.1 HD domain-containing protein [Ectothiorhodospira variabilis]MCG5505320.1 HD domain-containing protein [Ectothiorhodospira variabilis]MCG5508506.1 HD domain-containing protein [Ectothiorhodospira variabilis]MCG5525926.1 HD domain-containing protein [Ectothiorhodospira haloalkaliphila]